MVTASICRLRPRTLALSAFALLLGTLSLSAVGIEPARAADYTVKYALVSGDHIEIGQVETCEFKAHCLIKLPGLTATLAFYDRKNDQISLFVDGGSHCCLFSDAQSILKLNMAQRSHVTIFFGRERKGNEFIENQEIGTLSLVFSKMK